MKSHSFVLCLLFLLNKIYSVSCFENSGHGTTFYCLQNGVCAKFEIYKISSKIYNNYSWWFDNFPKSATINSYLSKVSNNLSFACPSKQPIPSFPKYSLPIPSKNFNFSQAYKVTNRKLYFVLSVIFLLSGQNVINPGPTCSLCAQIGRKNQLIVQCVQCFASYHRTCLNISYHAFKQIDPSTWKCNQCTSQSVRPACTICKLNREKWILLTCIQCQESKHRACIRRTKPATTIGEKWKCEKCEADKSPSHQTKIPSSCTQPLPKLSSGIKMGHLNVRDLTTKNKKQDLEFLINHYEFDIFGVTETWLTPEVDDNEINLNGYQLIRKDRDVPNWRHRGGVLALYVKDDFTILSTHFDVLSPAESFSAIVSKPNMKQLKITLLYRPPKCSNKFFESLESYFLSSLPFESFFLGDWNIDTTQKSPNSVKLNSICIKYNYEQMIKTTTRNTMNSNSLIDLIIVNQKASVRQNGVVPCALSDHDLTFIVRKLPKNKNK